MSKERHFGYPLAMGQPILKFSDLEPPLILLSFTVLWVDWVQLGGSKLGFVNGLNGVPQKLILFRNRVFIDMISEDEVILK